MSLRCLIVDDEPLAHEVILRYMEDVPFLQTAGQCYRAMEALEFLSRQPVDLIFLDIRMPKLNGLDFLRTLQQQPIVIITSAYEEHALESFELEVCDYLLKPFRFDRFLKAANRALSIYNLKQQAGNNTPVAVSATPTEPAALYIKSDKKLIQLNPEELYYFESLGNYVKVWDASRFVLTPRTLSSFESQLPADTFIRIHKSYILNKKFVRYLEGNTITLKNGKQLPLGKNYKHQVKLLLGGQGI
ncbi:LytR/AlgR family response regulator transcription factor [Chitinophaga pinensis]|uniref:Two component transcriptional regulator, LytTR family n=1 Tax=Chitinophaga pinensis (strain ATCC 43595 / DSM 2588 / LMG 13176 / NBRC 15968 / NCIMB 11800 / UQM 2034) TaxID=485918 RepID=A0A979GXU1_CHIPD|nr:LytTR family DNA-binding domain-containing protein [Chitinophaga pinensis]ACU62661.1 two component transcriptional regulator, LytTR family [Chitinophaga pinensis DSM 2588]